MTTASIVRQAIAQVGIIAAVRCRAPVGTMLEVGDALLATPLTVVAVSPGSHQPWQSVAELCSRFGANMLVGAGPLSTPLQVETAIAAGAQFVICSSFALPVGSLCRRHGVLYLPGVATPVAAAQAERDGWRQQVLFPPGRDRVATLRRLQLTCPAVHFLPMGGVMVENLPDYALAGAAGAVVRGVIGARAKWDMAALITQMRRVRAAWVAGLTEQSV